MSAAALAPLPTPVPPIGEPVAPDTGIFPRRWTVQEYHRAAQGGVFGPDERLDLIQGEILKKVAQNPPHRTALRNTAKTLERTLGAGFEVFSQAPFVASADTEPEPDVYVVPGASNDYADRDIQTSDILLLVEVSDTTIGFDRGRKAAVYAEAGVADYWVLNVQERCLEVRREPATLPPGEPFPFGYQTITVFQEPEAVAPLASPDRPVRVADLLPPPPQTGERS